METSLSTAEEIKNRRDPLYGGYAKLRNFELSIIRQDTLILAFEDGSQANMSQEEFDKL